MKGELPITIQHYSPYSEDRASKLARLKKDDRHQSLTPIGWHGVKFILDGSIQLKTAALNDPYEGGREKGPLLPIDAFIAKVRFYM